MGLSSVVVGSSGGGDGVCCSDGSGGGGKGASHFVFGVVKEDLIHSLQVGVGESLFLMMVILYFCLIQRLVNREFYSYTNVAIDVLLATM